MDIEPKSKANQVTRRIGRKEQESGGPTAAGIRARSISPNEVRLREKACSERGRPAPLPGNTPPSPTYATGPCSNLRTGNRTPAQFSSLEAMHRLISVKSGKQTPTPIGNQVTGPKIEARLRHRRLIRKQGKRPRLKWGNTDPSPIRIHRIGSGR